MLVTEPMPMSDERTVVDVNNSRGSTRTMVSRIGELARQRVKLTDCDRFILVNVNNIPMKSVWKELKAILMPEMFKGILSLKRVRALNGRARIDLYVDKAVSSGLKRTIRSMTEHRSSPTLTKALKSSLFPGVNVRTLAVSRWRIDLWKPWRDRVSPPAKIKIQPSENWHDAFMTINVNGLTSKYAEVTDMLLAEQISVCAIQEHLVSARAYKIRFTGYTVYTQHWKEGFRGQALLVRNHLSSYEVGSVEDLYIHIKVNGIKGLTEPANVIAVYLPSGGNFRRERKRRLRLITDLCQKILEKAPQAPILIMGDWNMRTTELRPLIESRQNLTLIKTRGSPLSRFPTRAAPADIDHMIGSPSMERLIRRPRILRNYGISDHRPLCAKVRAVVITPPQQTKWRYDMNAIKELGYKLVTSNRWTPLDKGELTDMDNLTNTTQKFIDIMNEECKRIGIMKPSVPGKPRLPRKLVTLLKRRNTAAKKLSQSVQRGSDPALKCERAFADAQNAWQTAHRLWQSKQSEKSREIICMDIRGCNYRQLWKRVDLIVKGNAGSSAMQPVRNKDGVLCTDAESILAAIAEHYDHLANGEAGRSQHEAYWDDVDILTEPGPTLEDLNDGISWPDVLKAIRRTKRNTAVNPRDLIHANVLKELLNEECMATVKSKNPHMTRPDLVKFALADKDLPTDPLTPMGKALYPILKRVWELEQTPDQWNEVYIRSLFKDGDPELMANYRGISLISVALKVLLNIMADRLYTNLVSRDMLAVEQSGFRRNEEAMGQFIAIAEITRRRHIEKLPTYAVFIDFKKAFDRVHHEALYRILEHMGVRGRFLNMVKYIYRNSRMSVMAGGQCTDFFGMLRGTRQGCPLSPLLFIIFVNQLLQECSGGGVTVPGLESLHYHKVCKGGMYADDVVATEGSAAAAQTFIINVYHWGKKWGMDLGIKKCGVMCFTDDEDTLADHNNTIYGCPDGDLPVVGLYKYLGIQVDPTFPTSRKTTDMNEATYVKAQAAKGEKALHALRPLLSDRVWPLPIKVACIRTLLVPIMMYGAEWLGWKKLNADPLQRVLNKAIKIAMGNSSRSTAFEGLTLCYELGIPTIQEEQNALRTRLFAKLTKTDKVKTWIGILARNPLHRRQRTWVSTNIKEEADRLRLWGPSETVSPLRKWATLGKIYEAHTRSNDFRSNSIDSYRRLYTEVDDLGYYPKTTALLITNLEPETEGGPVITYTHYGPEPLTPTELDLDVENMDRINRTRDTQARKDLEWSHICKVRDCVLEGIMMANKSVAFGYYNQWGFGSTRDYIRNSLANPELTGGIYWLVRVRTRALPRVIDRHRQLRRTFSIPTFDHNKCPLCGDLIDNGFEWAHLMVNCDHVDVDKIRHKTLSRSITLLRDELSKCPDIDNGCEEDFFGNRTVDSDLIPLDRAIAIYLVGGVVKDFFDPSYHRGFGQLDELPIGLDCYGFTYSAQFLSEVMPLYMKCLFGNERHYYRASDGFESVYTNSGGSRTDFNPSPFTP
jgi:exonuclease III